MKYTPFPTGTSVSHEIHVISDWYYRLTWNTRHFRLVLSSHMKYTPFPTGTLVSHEIHAIPDWYYRLTWNTRHSRLVLASHMKYANVLCRPSGASNGEAPCSQTPSICVVPFEWETRFHTHTNIRWRYAKEQLADTTQHFVICLRWKVVSPNQSRSWSTTHCRLSATH
jgi:hypothetical protein